MFHSCSKKFSKKKTKSQRAQRAGGCSGPVGLRVLDPSVRLCLRRLGDACNSISQRLLTHAASSVRSTGGVEVQLNQLEVEVGIGVDRPLVLEEMGESSVMKDECAALAHRLFIASLTLFEAVGDINNAAMVRCNLSSLLRSQATWEMAKYSSRYSQSLQSDVANSAYQQHYECSTRYLKEAQKHCALAVFDDSSTATNNINSNNSGSRGAEGSMIDKGRQDSPKISMQVKSATSSTRNAVALETAQTCLNLGKSKREGNRSGYQR